MSINTEQVKHRNGCEKANIIYHQRNLKKKKNAYVRNTEIYTNKQNYAKANFNSDKFTHNLYDYSCFMPD